MADSQLRLCPFCREVFDGPERCPAHDLALVPAHRLPAPRDEDEDVLVWLFELRRGRGVVLLGAGLVLVGFLLPLFVDGTGSLPPLRGLSVASSVAPVLFLVPAAAALVASIALRRGTERALRRMRVVVPFLGLIILAVEGHVLFRVLVASGGSLARGLPGEVAVGYGAGFVFVGAAFMLAGGPVLGGAPPSTR